MICLNNNREIQFDEWQRIITSLNLSERLENAGSIVIKPNFAAGTYSNPNTHVMSDLSLLQSCVRFLLECNPKAVIYIAESDSTGYGFAYQKFEHLGLPDSLNLPPMSLNRIRMLDLSRDRLVRIENELFKHYVTIDHQLWLSRILMDSDFKISLSNLKTHAVTGYTGACKNLFGCLPDFDKAHNHPIIAKVIHDLVIAINPDLSVVDAFYGMEKNGPVQGIDVDSGYRVFSNNAIEADIYAADTIGYPPQRIQYLRLLSRTFDIELKLATKTDTIREYKKPSVFLRFMNCVGLNIQKCGQAIASFGHRIHSCPTPLVLIITIFRPILLKMFSYERLKKWKRTFVK